VRVPSGEFQIVAGQKHDIGQLFTAAETIHAKKEILGRVEHRQYRAAPIMPIHDAIAHSDKHQRLTTAHRAARSMPSPPAGQVQGCARSLRAPAFRSVREGADQRGSVVEDSRRSPATDNGNLIK
jgi:hypothetical protein